jgi:AraC family transcriptional regulator, transcriptional activator of pobA
MDKPHLFQTFDEYYQATKSGIIAPNNDFHIFRYRDIKPSVVSRMELFRLTFYQFNICRTSNSLINIAGSSEISKDKQLIIFTPGRLAEWEKFGLWEGYILFVKESFIRVNSTNLNARLMHNFLSPESHPITSLDDRDYDLLQDLCEKMIYEYENFKAENLLVIENYLQVFLVYVKRIQEKLSKTNPAEFPTAHMEIHSRFLNLVEKQFLDQKTVSVFADQLNITPGYLNECVKSVSGKSAKDVINQVVLLEAKSLLKQTSLPIKEIAFELNFQDYSHFVKFFKANTNYTPAAFRDLP